LTQLVMEKALAMGVRTRPAATMEAKVICILNDSLSRNVSKLVVGRAMSSLAYRRSDK
jgi:hypothetical protein